MMSDWANIKIGNILSKQPSWGYNGTKHDHYLRCHGAIVPFWGATCSDKFNCHCHIFCPVVDIHADEMHDFNALKLNKIQKPETSEQMCPMENLHHRTETFRALPNSNAWQKTPSQRDLQKKHRFSQDLHLHGPSFQLQTSRSKWIPGFTWFHMVSHCFYVTTKSTNLRHGLTKLHLSIYDSKWLAGITAVWGLVFLYSKLTCSTCLMFFPGKSLKIMK